MGSLVQPLTLYAFSWWSTKGPWHNIRPNALLLQRLGKGLEVRERALHQAVPVANGLAAPALPNIQLGATLCIQVGFVVAPGNGLLFPW